MNAQKLWTRFQKLPREEQKQIAVNVFCHAFGYLQAASPGSELTANDAAAMFFQITSREIRSVSTDGQEDERLP